METCTKKWWEKSEGLMALLLLDKYIRQVVGLKLYSGLSVDLYCSQLLLIR
jgi:hypothetical protein